MKVEKLSWTAPEFFTIAWVSPDARDYWEPKIKAISSMWNELERLSVAESIRDFAVQFVAPHKLIQLAYDCGRNGLCFFPLEFNGVHHRVVIFRDETETHHEEFVEAWNKSDNKTIGEMLSFPECCSNWFTELWGSGKRDTCLAQARGSQSVEEAAACNILLRDVGCRPVFHLPCSYACSGTAWISRLIHQLAYDKGKRVEFDTLWEILHWPVKYSALHGIAEITTPVFKLRRNTDYTHHNEIVRYMGTLYPLFGASGLDFPFRKQQFVPLRVPDNWSDNGFPSRFAMRDAHDLIIKELGSIVERDRHQSLIDLGCGNGELLRRVREAFPNLEVTGVDAAAFKLERAKKVVSAGHFLLADVTRMEFDQTYDIILVAQQRLEEAKRSGNEQFAERLTRYGKTVIRYNYNLMKAEVIHGKGQGGQDSEAAPDVGSSSQSGPERNGGGGTSDDGHGRSEDSRGSERFVPDWAFETGKDSNER